MCGFLLSHCSSADQEIRHISYNGTDELFPNPERGIYVRYNSVPGQSGLNSASLEQDRSNNITQIGKSYYIEEFIHSDFTREFLDQIAEDFNTARKAGVKLHPRFRYTLNMDHPDAPLDQVLRHIKQLQPVFEEHFDVLSFLQAGFIGAWGEWHASSNNLDSPENMRAIQLALLDALPVERTSVVRSPRHKMNIFQTNLPLTPDQAFDGSYIARTGHHNDCFLADETDVGTYVPHVYPEFDNLEPHSIESIKDYLATENRYLPMGGETCNPRPDAGDRYHCETALAEMDRLHWSYLHRDYSRHILNTWEDQGCMEEVERRLGYRLAMLEGAFGMKSDAGDTFYFDLTLQNQGFASPFNPRDVQVVLRSTGESGKEWTIDLPDDPRYWFGGSDINLNYNLRLPDEIPAGEYNMFLFLPDPVEQLRKRPEYAIRLANEDTWEQSTGYNRLGHQIVILNETTLLP
ncbi:DUF4832 domain-containing protein [Balneolales bacterium ANBcel1]|nr:DUF4832 domain-containing protein [Balneolales bacterium ANBcel1]